MRFAHTNIAFEVEDVTTTFNKALTNDAITDYIKKRGIEARRQQGEDMDISDTQIALAFRVDQAGQFIEDDGPICAFFPIFIV